MAIEHKIRDKKKLQYDIIREAVKILALPSGKNDNTNKFLIKNYLEQVQFTYYPLQKSLEKNRFKLLQIKKKSK